MKRKLLFMVFALTMIFSYAQDKKGNFFDYMDINSYIQLRTTTNFKNTTNAYIKRLKAWIKSRPRYSEHWGYKIKVVISSSSKRFILEDAKVIYSSGIFLLELGQLSPQYSLERFQKDYNIPALDRATTINTIIPNGTIGVRDVGVQLNIVPKQKWLKTHIGIFNGYGIKKYQFNNQGYLITHKTELMPLKNLLLGYSLSFRRAYNLAIPKVIPDTVLFTGNDFRYNFFVKYQNKDIWLQGEYLNASLNNLTAYGYYLLSAYTFKKNQISFSYEQYHSTFDNGHSLPYYSIGYHYFIDGYKIRLSLGNKFQIDNSKMKNYFTSLQFQFFIH